MTTGILALWNDRDPARAAEYEAWYVEEHLPERLSIPGFRRGRRYESLGQGPQFFTYYEVDEPEVLVSAPYLDRVNDPTPRTHAIMSETFTNMSRTICTVAKRAGKLRGSHAITLQTDLPGPEAISALSARAGIARVELWRAADVARPAPNAEQALRGPDAEIEACLFVETFRLANASRLAIEFPRASLYRLLGELEADPE